MFGDGVPPPAQTRFDCEESEELGVDGELMTLSVKRKVYNKDYLYVYRVNRRRTETRRFICKPIFNQGLSSQNYFAKLLTTTTKTATEERSLSALRNLTFYLRKIIMIHFGKRDM